MRIADCGLRIAECGFGTAKGREWGVDVGGSAVSAGVLDWGGWASGRVGAADRR